MAKPAKDSASRGDAPGNPEPAPFIRRRTGVLAIVILLGAVAFAAFQLHRQAGPAAVRTSAPAMPAIGGPFSLIDQDGKAVTEASFRGKFMLVYFGYTYCPDICPTTLTDIGDALDMLGADADKVVPIFITVDPARDTPEHMKEYLGYFNPRFVGLTGTPSQVATAAKAYRVYYAKAKPEAGAAADPLDYSMDHTSIVYLMGPKGGFKAHFPHGTTAAAMAKKIRELL